MLIPTNPVAGSLTILLARHAMHDEVGSVLSGRSDIALNDAGRDQAAKLSDHLSTAPLTQVHTSPRRRARETAAMVADRHGLEPTATDALDEIDFGEWAGQSFAALENDPRWLTWNTDRASAATPSGETMSTAIVRALRHLEACEDGCTVLCVSHCDIIRGIIAHYLGLHLDQLLSFDIDPASVTTIKLEDSIGRIVAVNERVS